jgi:toxin ParE1/3/4
MVQIRWTTRAIGDSENIIRYISEDSIYYAEITIYKINKRTEIIKQNVFIGKMVSEFELPEIREVKEGYYRIIYRVVNDSTVDILSLFHSSRELTKDNFEI